MEWLKLATDQIWSL